MTYSRPFLTLSVCFALLPTAVCAQQGPSPSPTVPAAGTALVEALNHFDTTQALKQVDQGADPNTPCGPGQQPTALGIAAALGDSKLVQAMLAHGAQVNPTNPQAIPPLVAVLTLNTSETMVRLLLEKGARVNEPKSRNLPMQPLALAAQKGDLAVVKLLLDKGATVGYGEGIYPTALAAAAGTGHIAVMKLLIARGAHPARDPFVAPMAISGGSVPVLELLLSHSVRFQNPPGTTLVHLAARSGKPEMIERMLRLDKGAQTSINAEDESDETPLMIAARAGHLEAVKLLLKKGARANAISRHYRSALDVAFVPEPGIVADGDPRQEAVVAVLRKAGGQFTPPSLWHGACGARQELSDLLAKGTNPNTRDARGQTPLYYALRYPGNIEDTEIVAQLLAAGAKPQDRTQDGIPLLAVAIARGYPEAVRLLLSHGATPNCADQKDGMTPLMTAAKKKEAPENLAIVRLLIASKAQINAQDSHGHNALWYAEKARNRQIVQLLQVN